ncbi:MAG: thioredoxin [Clostridia bacterium]|nr:thioredoxin [Clostridia bacterium]
MPALHFNQDNFAEIVEKSSPVLVDFWAPWCGPCRMVSPIIDQLADEHPELVIGKVNVDEEPELAQAFGVMSIPTLIVLRDGKEAERAVGAMPKSKILALLQ